MRGVVLLLWVVEWTTHGDNNALTVCQHARAAARNRGTAAAAGNGLHVRAASLAYSIREVGAVTACTIQLVNESVRRIFCELIQRPYVTRLHTRLSRDCIQYAACNRHPGDNEMTAAVSVVAAAAFSAATADR